MTSLVVVAVGILTAVAVVDALRGEQASPQPAEAAASTESVSTEPQVVTAPSLTLQQQIEEIGNRWAVRFAAGPLRAACRYETQPLCEWFACKDVGGVTIRNCTPPTSALRNSFFGATVQDLELRGYRAAARFSNGEVVEFHGDAGTWRISKLGENAGRGFFESPKEAIKRIGNNWAPLFAVVRGGCNGYMVQPVCERIACERPGGIEIKDCTPLTRAYRESFANATVEDIEVSDGRAAARFSNGEVVEFAGGPDGWWISKVGGNAGRAFFD